MNWLRLITGSARGGRIGPPRTDDSALRRLPPPSSRDGGDWELALMEAIRMIDAAMDADIAEQITSTETPTQREELPMSEATRQAPIEVEAPRFHTAAVIFESGQEVDSYDPVSGYFDHADHWIIAHCIGDYRVDKTPGRTIEFRAVQA